LTDVKLGIVKFIYLVIYFPGYVSQQNEHGNKIIIIIITTMSGEDSHFYDLQNIPYDW
jgi:hypothetical protein